MLNFKPHIAYSLIFHLPSTSNQPCNRVKYYTCSVYARTYVRTGTAAFIDAEHALDPVYAKNLGVNVDDLLVCQVSLKRFLRTFFIPH